MSGRINLATLDPITGQLLPGEIPSSVVTGSSRAVTGAAVLSAADRVLLADATGQQPPTNLAVAAVGSGGTFAARTGTIGYYWAVTATGPNGESIAPPTYTWTPIVANGSAILTWTAAPGATGYKVYRSNYDESASTATPRLVATLGNVTTYTDTGTATTATNPPTDNGAAFPITVPSAASFSSVLTIRATGRTPNLITLQAPGGQTIEGLASVLIGDAPGAAYSSVLLVSDGANWFIAAGARPRIGIVQGANVFNTSCPAGVNTPLVVIPQPALALGQRMSLWCSMQVNAGSACTQLSPSINVCDSAGNTPTDVPVDDHNLAFWFDQAFTPGEWHMFTGHWFYDPRPGDISIETVSAGVADLGFLGLHMQPVGDSAAVTSSMLIVAYGAIASSYWPSA